MKHSRIYLSGIALIAGAAVLIAADNSEKFFIYRQGSVQETLAPSQVDAIELTDNGTRLTISDPDGNEVFNRSLADVHAIELGTESTLPAADLLDVRFNSDGSAYDASPMANQIVRHGSPSIERNWEYDLQTARINNAVGAEASHFFSVDYAGNSAFTDALRSGHSLEAVVQFYDGYNTDKEIKYFSSHQAGGTGLVLEGNGEGRGNDIAFFLNVTENGNSNWIKASSGICTYSGHYYHIVGVWDKAAGRARVYVDGVCSGDVAARGELRMPSAGCNWFGIGADPKNTDKAESGGNFEIVKAKIYSYPLSDHDVARLYATESESLHLEGADAVMDIRFNADGSVTDAGTLHQNVQKYGNIPVYYDSTLGTYVATFRNTPGAEAAAYCKVDYTNNSAFRNVLSGSHTFETVMRLRTGTSMPEEELKWFSTHQSGGSGFLIAKSNHGHHIIFLPHVGGEWRWTDSNIVPAHNQFYHIVGVWDKSAGKARIYVNGLYKGEVDAAGDFKFPNDGATWMGIGADSKHNGVGELGGDFDIAVARVYNSALGFTQIQALYNNTVRRAVTPHADLMDVEFRANNSAVDLSPKAKAVEHIGNSTTYYNEQWGGYVARFDNTWGDKADGCFKVNYEKDTDFRNRLKDGHTLEAVVLADYDGTYLRECNNKEAKFLASHQGGGTGLMMREIRSKGNSPYFLPDGADNYTTMLVNTDKTWRWGAYASPLTKGEFHHVLGIFHGNWAEIYVDGRLCGGASTTGNYTEPSAGSMWFAIGADPNGSEAHCAWKGEVAMARVYDTPMCREDAQNAYAAVRERIAAMNKARNPLVSDVQMNPDITVYLGGHFGITGRGFEPTDRITIQTAAGQPKVCEFSIKPYGVSVKVPAEMNWKTEVTVRLTRGARTQELGKMNICTRKPSYDNEYRPGVEVIAHRGNHSAGAPENSRQSLREAQALNVYGSETDCYITTDGALVVNHNTTYDGLKIEDATLAQCRAKKLSNGESLPTIDEFLDMIKSSPSRTKLIIEIKDHSTPARNQAAGRLAVQKVAERGLQDKVEYISFNDDACAAIIAADRSARVAHLQGNKHASSWFRDQGYTGIDYSMSYYNDHNDWVWEAHNLGLTVNSWTIRSIADMYKQSNLGCDFITTDWPEQCERMRYFYGE